MRGDAVATSSSRAGASWKIAGLAAEIRGQAGHALSRIQIEIGHRLVAHVFHHVQFPLAQRQTTAIGQQVLGVKEGTTALDGVNFQTRPLYTGKPWFLAPSVAYYRWRDNFGR